MYVRRNAGTAKVERGNGQNTSCSGSKWCQTPYCTSLITAGNTPIRGKVREAGMKEGRWTSIKIKRRKQEGKETR